MESSDKFDLFNIRFLAVIAYFGPFFLMGKFSVEKEDPFVKFHTKQGEILFFFMLVLNIMIFTIGFFLNNIIDSFEIISILCYIGINASWVIFALLGIIGAFQFKKNRLPFIWTKK